jgi:hypothetical protein
MELPGVGPFIGYQICVDLGYWNKEVYDDDKHVVLGPGAKKGLLWLFSPTSKLTKIQQIHHLRDIHGKRCTRATHGTRTLPPNITATINAATHGTV